MQDSPGYTHSLSLQVLDAMNQDSGTPLRMLRVDGGMTANNLLLELQSNVLGIPVGGCGLYALLE